MPSLSQIPSRHVVIDKRPGHYLSFPDVCLTATGRLLCVYRQADQHVAARSVLLAAHSDDLGQTWTPPQMLNVGTGHCPRLTRLSDGRIVAIDDHSQSLYWSMDNGCTFMRQPATGVLPIPDRIIPLRPDFWLSTGHVHHGSQANPKIRQAPSQQLTMASSNEGGSWANYSVLACDPSLVLCEASVMSLPDGRLLALLRENSFVFEPMYISISDDLGATWGLPRPTPLIGHRPCLDLTPQGKLLATYRNVGPDGGTAAWMGSLDELDQDFAVHGLHPAPDNPTLTPQGLLVENAPGPEACVRYALRPMTDPERATAELHIDILVEEAQEKACAVHFGEWWRLFPDRIEVGKDTPSIALTPGAPLSLRLRYTPGQVAAEVNGLPAGTYPVDPRKADTRAILVGNASVTADNGGTFRLRSLALSVREPRYERDYAWSWNHTQGHPDAWARAHVLELANDRLANSGDYGYSGWVALPDGRYFCAYHHGDAAQPDYIPSRSSHVRGTWFTDSDFTATHEAS